MFLSGKGSSALRPLTTACTTGTSTFLTAIARFPGYLSVASMGTPKLLNPARTTIRLRCTYRPRKFPPTTKSIFSRPKTTSAGRPAPSRVEQESLPWAEYLTIRKNKRRWETAVTIPLTIAGFAGGVAFFGNLEMDPTKPIFNIDPMVVYGVATLGCAGFGYLLGPVVGSTCWRITHRRAMKLIEARDRQFHQHIVKNRVDPSAQSATNPVPDYYGEKIGSLHSYRQWLRDQAKFRRKAFLPEDLK